MSITVSDVQAVCDFGRAGWVNCKVTRSDGTFAWLWVWVNGAYSAAPGLAADGTARTVGGDGVYSGLGALELAAAPAADWSAPPAGLDATSAADPGPAPTADPTDAGVIADVASAVSDSGVVSAATTAATADPPGTYAVRILLDLYGSGGSTPLVPEVSYGHPATTSPNVADDDWLTVGPLDQSGAIGDYVSITWTSSNPSVVTLSPGSLLGPADTHLSATITTHASGSATLTVAVVSTAAPSPGMVLSVGVVVP